MTAKITKIRPYYQRAESFFKVKGKKNNNSIIVIEFFKLPQTVIYFTLKSNDLAAGLT